MKPQELDSLDWLGKLLEQDRPGTENVLIYYEHRIGAFCRDPRLMLAPLDDHLIHRGDGIFETLRMSEGKLFELQAHIERLKQSASVLRLVPPCTWEEIRDLLLALAKASGARQGGVKLLMGRGGGGLGVDPAESRQSSLYVIVTEEKPYPENFWEKGLTACRSAIPCKQDYLARIKSTNYLPNVLMAMEARQKGVDLSIAFDEKGNLAEAAVANVGMVDAGGQLIFPTFDHILPGTTAILAMDTAKEFMPVRSRDIAEEELHTAAEILVFGTGPECVGVTHYEGQAIGKGAPGPVARKLRAALHKALLDGGTPY